MGSTDGYHVLGSHGRRCGYNDVHIGMTFQQDMILGSDINAVSIGQAVRAVERCKLITLDTSCRFLLCRLAVLEITNLRQRCQLVYVGLLQVAVPQLRARLPDLLLQQQLVVLLPLQLHAPGVQLAAQPGAEAHTCRFVVITGTAAVQPQLSPTVLVGWCTGLCSLCPNSSPHVNNTYKQNCSGFIRSMVPPC